MITSEDTLIAGISGGADSVCLLFVLLELQKNLGFSLEAVHVNHRLRGSDADGDEAFVAELCREHAVPCTIYHKNVESIAKKRKQSLEEAGRVVRRQAFFETMKTRGGTKIVTAHHKNDNAETLLMNLARGSGLRGLGGISPVNGAVIRPLLCVEREEIESYLHDRGIGWRTDASNADDAYTRNRVRNHVIPFLQEEVNARAVAHMNETAEQLQMIRQYMDRQVDAAWETCVRTEEAQTELLEESYRQVDAALGRMLIRRCIVRAAACEKDITLTHVTLVEELFQHQVGRKLDLPYHTRVQRTYRGISFAKKREVPGKKQEAVLLKIPGVTEIPWLNMTICCTFIENTEEFLRNSVPQKTYTKCMDYDIIKDDLFVRTRESGDYIVIRKQGGTQKIKNYFINEKIPADKRDTIPLIAQGKEILWIVGHRMSSSYQIGEQTKRVLQIQVNGGESNGRDSKRISFGKRG